MSKRKPEETDEKLKARCSTKLFKSTLALFNPDPT
jgi:hypothetical protein